MNKEISKTHYDVATTVSLLSRIVTGSETTRQRTGLTTPNLSLEGAQIEFANVFDGHVIPIFYIVVCVVGLLGNGIVIAALKTLMVKNRRTSVNDILVMNLSIADCIFLAGLPFWATQDLLYQGWPFGTFGCKILSFNTLLNLYASVFFVVAMGIDRCVAVVFFTEAMSHRTPKRAVAACVIIWTLAVAVASQALWLREVVPEPPIILCVWNLPDEYASILFGFRVVIGFIIPFSIMLCCYVMILVKLKQRVENSATTSSSLAVNQKKITAAILAVMTVFVACWLPNHIVNILHAATALDPDARNQYGMKIAGSLSTCLAYANSALNPIVYALMKEDIREESKKMISKLLGRFQPCRRFGRARQSFSRFRGMTFSLWRSTTATTAVSTTATAKYRRAGEKHDFIFRNEDLPQSLDSPPSYRSFAGNEIVYRHDVPDLEHNKMNLVVNVTDEDRMC